MFRSVDFIRNSYISVLFTALLLAGCGVNSPETLQQRQKERAASLETVLTGLNEKVDAREAKLLAQEAVRYAHTLSQRYNLVWPPLLHNTLVNIGVKERGLCHEWADDMLAHLSKTEYESFDFYLGVSNMGKLNEHNSLVVTAKGTGFSHGVVMDPWRGSGTLFFIKVEEDRNYAWKHRANK